MSVESQICCGCHKEKEVFHLRTGVLKCADCMCDQIGRPTMDLFRKACRIINAPIKALLAVKRDSSSLFLSHLFHARIKTHASDKKGVVVLLEDLTPETLGAEFTLVNITRYAKEKGFNCVVVGDDTETIALGAIVATACGDPGMARWLATDDFENYEVPLLRPCRQCLLEETCFYCRHHNLEFDNQDRILDEKFPHEKALLADVVADGHGSAPFAVQKLAERIQSSHHDYKCEKCGLFSTQEGVCMMCSLKS